ncbi:MAG: NADP-dependent oxidoreductase [Calditrichota bacterium]
MEKNRQYRLAKRPTGLPTADVWEYVESDIPQPGDGELLLKTQYISLDPAMRGWMNPVRSYIPPVELGDVMRAGTISEVVSSNNDHFKPGMLVSGMIGVQTHGISDGKGLYPIDTSIAPAQRFLSVLGLTGMTAYFGLLDVGDLKEGDVVVVSGAAGAVGSVVGQIARIKGCKTIGIAGGPEKCKQLLEEYRYDEAIDYKSDNIRKALHKAAPDGIDVYFDNVGGEILDTVLTKIRMRARIVICGAISQYNNTTPIQGPSNYLSLLVNRARMEGFVVFDYAKQYRQAAIDMAGWMASGDLIAKEHIVEGIETFPDRLLMLFDGRNDGKLILKV